MSSGIISELVEILAPLEPEILSAIKSIALSFASGDRNAAAIRAEALAAHATIAAAAAAAPKVNQAVKDIVSK